jgi:spermidine synthase
VNGPAGRTSAFRRLSILLAGGVVLLLVAYLLRASFGSRVIFAADSAFGGARVVEHADGLRSLYTGAGRARQSAVYPGRPEHLESAYTRVNMIGVALAPADGHILFIGLGGGAMPMFTRVVRSAAHLDVVEIDPLIIDVAADYFGFRTDSLLVVHAGDGRAFIEAAPPGAYDLVVLDAFSDDEIPYALATRQFLEAVRAILAPGGFVTANLWGSNRLYPSMLATWAAVFDEVGLIRVGRGVQRILVASADRPIDRTRLVAAARAFDDDVRPPFDLSTLVEQGWEPWPTRGAAVLEDGGGFQ